MGKKSLDDLLKLEWVDNNTESEAKNAGNSREAQFTFVNWNVQTFFDGKKD